MKPKHYLSIKELAESDLLPGKNSEASIRAMIARKTIPYRKLSGRIYFLRDEIEEWLRSREGNPLGRKRRPNPEIQNLASLLETFDSTSLEGLKEAIEELSLIIEMQNI